MSKHAKSVKPALSLIATSVVPAVIFFGLSAPSVANANAACSTSTEIFTSGGTTYAAQKITTPGVCDWVLPAGVTSFDVLLVAGGGGGGGGTSNDSGRAGGGGGGGGQVGINPLTADPGTIITVTVGAGGVAGGGALNGSSGASTDGGDGANTQLSYTGTSLFVVGGKGGKRATNSGGAGGNEGANTFSGGAASGTSGGSGASGASNGSTTTAVTAGVSYTGYSANALVLSNGGGGAQQGAFGLASNTPGSGGRGGRGSLGLQVESYGYNGGAGSNGMVIIRYVVSAPSTPGAPTAVIAGSSADLSWSAPASSGASAITGYLIEQSTDGGATWSTVVANTGSSATSASVSGLATGTNYLFRVSAINSIGTSSASSASAVVSLTPPPPAPYMGPIIQNLGMTAVAEQTVTIVNVLGERLDSITAAEIDGKAVKILAKTAGTLKLELPALAAGVKDLVVTSAMGKLTHQAAFSVNKAPSQVGKVNAYAYKGKLSVYAGGLAGSRISWRVAGVWGSAVASSNYAIFNRPTPRAGVTVSVDVYVNGVKTLTKSVVTR